MKTKLKTLTGLVLLIFLTTSLTLVALAETSDKDESLFNREDVALAPDGIGLLATTFNVTSTTDAGDANLGDGKCASAASVCTLRAAIQEANALAGSDTIMVSSGTYNLTLGDLRITTTMTIIGNGAGSTTINGTGTSRIFRIQSTGVATVSDVTLTNGNGTGGASGGGDKGGAIWIFHGVLTLLNSTVTGNTNVNNDGGGILNEDGVLTIENSLISNNTGYGGGGVSNRNGTTTINNTTISGNTAKAAGPDIGVGVGGGVSNVAVAGDATLTINQSSITTNTATGTGGGGVNNNASNNHTATTTLNQTLVSGNNANPTVVSFATGLGGGIRNGFAIPAEETAVASVTVNNSEVSNNKAVNGGGIINVTDSTTSTLTLKMTLNNTTVSGNSTPNQKGGASEGNGGGLVNVNGTLSLVNSTVSGNSASGTHATGGFGGGLFNGDLNRITTLWLTNTTVSSNTAQTGIKGNGVANIRTSNTTTANFKNSILAGGCVNGIIGFPTTVGILTSHGNNLDDNNTCNLTATGDVPNGTPALGSLQSNGGPTIGATGATAPMLTHSLLKGSSAIDGGDNTTCNASPVNSLDQRGQARPGSGSSTCDMGAFELQGANLGLTKTASHTLVDSVTTITYTITVNNPLTNGASGVVVSDTLPISVTMVSSSTTNGSSYNPTTGVWSVGSVPASSNVVLTLVVSGTLNEGEVITNTATITTSNPPDLTSSDDTDSAAITVGSTGSTGVYLPIVIKN